MFLVAKRVLLFQEPVMAIYDACEYSLDTILVIFPGASPLRSEIEYRTKVILGKNTI